MFQFLIGTLKTSQLPNSTLNAFEFQFLIGTLKTVGVFVVVMDSFYVSIPDRYSKNAAPQN